MPWPIYKDKLVKVGNPEANIGVVVCWTETKHAIPHLSMDHVAAVGNLYSPARGLNYLVANVLAHPHINFLIVSGNDKLNGGQALIDLVNNGFVLGQDEHGKTCWRVIGDNLGQLNMDFSEDDLEVFRSTVRVTDCREWKIQELNELVLAYSKNGTPARNPREVKLKETKTSAALPNVATGHRESGRTVAEAWIKVLEYVGRFGVVSDTAYQSLQQESLTVVTVITDEDPSEPFYPDWFPMPRNKFEEYLPTVIEPLAVPEGVAYWYGDRMRVRWGDQIKKGIDKIRNQRETRQVMISLWDPASDMDSPNPPCINRLWLRIHAGKLYMVVNLRSNDMYSAYPGNAMSMRILQKMIRDEVDPSIPLGDLTLISDSAHIYDSSLDAAKAVIEQHRSEVVADERNVVDPGGIFVIRVENEIVVEHLSPLGTFLQDFHGRTAMQIYLKIHPFITNIEHALYLGTALRDAEIALRYGLHFIQDKPLELPLSKSNT